MLMSRKMIWLEVMNQGLVEIQCSSYENDKRGKGHIVAHYARWRRKTTWVGPSIRDGKSEA